MVLYVILFFAATCIGMAISVYAFGTGGKRKKIFEDIYFSVEDTDGIGVLYTKTGEYSAILENQFYNPGEDPTVYLEQIVFSQNNSYRFSPIRISQVKSIQ